MTEVPQMDLEKVAAIQHDIWAHWMRHLFSRCGKRKPGDLIIPAVLVEHWERQMETPYAELSEREKQSDRDVVVNFYIEEKPQWPKKKPSPCTKCF